MQYRTLQRKPIDLQAYRMRSAVEGDYDTLIDEPTVIMEHGKIAIVYMTLDTDCSDIVEALKTIEYETGYRTDGLKTTSAVLGYLPRNTIRRDYCTATRLAVQQPKQHAVVARYAAVVNQYYRSINPELFARHTKDTDEHVIGAYTIKDSVFTSGIINKNNPLKYHFDTGNFKDVWSCMLVFKGDVEGGYLSCPEFGIGFALRNNSLLMFDGQEILHGVTPIRRLHEDSYRYSIVYYSMRSMWGCEPLNDEVARIRKKKTEREQKRAAYIKATADVNTNAVLAHPVFIISQGNHQKATTAAAFRGSGIVYTVVVRESERIGYQRDYPNASLLVAPDDVSLIDFLQSHIAQEGIASYWIARDDLSGFEIERQNAHYPISANALMGYIEQHATLPGVHAPVCQRVNMPLALHIGNSDDVYSHDDTRVKVKRV